MKKIPSILLIDDDETTNFINQHIINRSELTDKLLIASNGRDAIELVKKRHQEAKQDAASRVPQLILLDINMPIMNGFEFLDNIKSVEPEDDRSTVIAVLTTSLNTRDIERVKQAGITEIISKPLTKESLQELASRYF